ncbi:MAG: TRAP transporter small permease [Pararhodobacter sp.]
MTDPEDDDDPGAAAPGGGAATPLPHALRPVLALAELAGALGLLALMGLTVTDALMRSFLNRPILGSGDLVQILLVLVVACSVPLCIAAGRAIAIEFLVQRLPASPRRWLHRVTALGAAAVLLYLAWRCHVNAGEAAMFGETTMLLRIPYGPFYAVLAVSFLISAALFALEAWRGKGLA